MWAGRANPAAGIEMPVAGIQMPIAKIQVPVAGIQMPAAGFQMPVTSHPNLLEGVPARALCCVLPPGGFFFFETLIALAKKKETIVDTDANFAQKYMSAGCHSWRSASFVCTLGTAWRMKVFVKKSIVNLMLRFVVCLLSLMFDVLLARADQ